MYLYKWLNAYIYYMYIYLRTSISTWIVIYYGIRFGEHEISNPKGKKAATAPQVSDALMAVQLAGFKLAKGDWF